MIRSSRKIQNRFQRDLKILTQLIDVFKKIFPQTRGTKGGAFTPTLVKHITPTQVYLYKIERFPTAPANE